VLYVLIIIGGRDGWVIVGWERVSAAPGTKFVAQTKVNFAAEDIAQ
jgi:hypothetical protein